MHTYPPLFNLGLPQRCARREVHWLRSVHKLRIWISEAFTQGDYEYLGVEFPGPWGTSNET